MKKLMTTAAAGMLAIASVAMFTNEAAAWGCVAQANDGTYGYSYNYPNKKAARQRAMAECRARTYGKCYITTCDPNG